MTARVQKWGNSLALRLPKVLAGEAHLAQGSVVDLTLEGDVLCVRAVAAPELTLDDLLAGVTDENRHSAVDVADGVGGEVW